MTYKLKKDGKEQENMPAVLPLSEYRHGLTPTKKNMCLKTKAEKTTYIHSVPNINKIVELEERESSSDEFSLLWNEEDQ